MSSPDDTADAEPLPLEFFQTLVEQSGDGIIMADERGVLRVFNPEAERQHGARKREVAAPEWAEAYGLFSFDGQKLPLEETPLFRALQGEKVTASRWVVKQSSGAERILSGTATPLRREDGSLSGAVLITRDDTERFASERERADLLHREQVARQEAERQRAAAQALAEEVTAQMREVEKALREAKAAQERAEQRLAELQKAQDERG